MSSQETGNSHDLSPALPGVDADAHAPPTQPRTPPATSEQDTPRQKNTTTPRLAKNSGKNQTFKHQNYNRLANIEMTRHYAEVSIETFKQDLFPPGEDLPGSILARATDKLRESFADGKVSNELQMYTPLCAAFNAVLQGTGFVMKDTSRHSNDPLNDNIPDLCMYRDDDWEGGRRIWTRKDDSERQSQKDSDADMPVPEGYKASVAWAWTQLFVECKYIHTRAPFGMRDFLTSGDYPQRARAQLIRYASEIFLRQHRNFLYSLVIVQTEVRFMRWDRAGVVVSKPFDFKTSPDLLLNFIYRFARAVDSRHRGYDPTAILADADEVKLLKTYSPSNPRAKPLWEPVQQDTARFPIYKIVCQAVEFKRPTDSSEHASTATSSSPPAPTPTVVTLTLLIGRHHAGHYSPTGRATRGYVALHVEKQRLVFLKDSWRAESGDIYPELEVYERLMTKGVSNIATAIGGGDVCVVVDGEKYEQRTLSQEYLGDEDILSRLHYRLVTKELGVPLSKYCHSFGLALCIMQAFTAHWMAWINADVLHRDVSDGNILIDIDSEDFENNPTAFLNDWDLCRYKEDLDKEATQHGRSGTWMFMSGLALQYPRKKITLSDDLESFVHVTKWNALRFHNHNLLIRHKPRTGDDDKDSKPEAYQNHKSFSLHMDDMYFTDEVLDGYHVGGQKKVESFKRPEPEFILESQHSALAGMIAELHLLCHEHYLLVDWAALEYLRAPSTTRPVASNTQDLRASNIPGVRARYMKSKATRKRFVRQIINDPPSEDPLSEHDEMYNVLQRAIEGPPFWDRNDKMEDKYKWLGIIRVESVKQFSASTLSIRNAASGTKRKSKDDGSQSKKFKTSPLPSHTEGPGAMDLSGDVCTSTSSPLLVSSSKSGGSVGGGSGQIA